jgi:peptide-methionine (S)-S-oxide reductase
MPNKMKETTATFAGGCFWCTEAVFRRVRGVTKVVSGYTGGSIRNPAYREICSGRTGHAEAIQVFYNENEVSYEELLEIFFGTHDPTTLNQQGNDKGTQYRSAVFYTNDIQRQQAENYIAMLEKDAVFENDIVTEVTELDVFYHAEDYHQKYYDNNKNQPYCHVIIEPKIATLRSKYQNKLKTV